MTWRFPRWVNTTCDSNWKLVNNFFFLVHLFISPNSVYPDHVYFFFSKIIYLCSITQPQLQQRLAKKTGWSNELENETVSWTRARNVSRVSSADRLRRVNFHSNRCQSFLSFTCNFFKKKKSNFYNKQEFDR